MCYGVAAVTSPRYAVARTHLASLPAGGDAAAADSALAAGLSGAAAQAWARAAAAHFLSLRVRWDNSEVRIVLKGAHLYLCRPYCC